MKYLILFYLHASKFSAWSDALDITGVGTSGPHLTIFFSLRPFRQILQKQPNYHRLSFDLPRQSASAESLHAAWYNSGPDLQQSDLFPRLHRQRTLWPPARKGQSSELLYGFTRCGGPGGVPRQISPREPTCYPSPKLLHYRGKEEHGHR